MLVNYLLLISLLQLLSPLLVANATDSNGLHVIVKDKLFGIHTKGPSLCIVNNTLIQFSYSLEGVLRYDLFDIEQDGNIDVISLKNEVPMPEKDNYVECTVYETSNSTTIIVVHSDEYHSLKYRIGKLNGAIIEWITQSPIIYADGGNDPSVAVASSGIVVSVHSGFESKKLFYNLGRLDRVAGKIEWISLVKYKSEYVDSNSSPKLFVVNDTLLIETHIEKGSLYYNFGEISGTDLDKMYIKWHRNEWVQYATCGGGCTSVDLMIDPFNIAMVSCTGKNNQLYYVTGALNENKMFIDWNEPVSFSKSPYSKTTVAFSKDYNNFYVEIHDSSDNLGLKMNVLAFDVEFIQPIKYGSYVTVGSVPFATEEIYFENNGPVTLQQAWTIKKRYSCTNTFHWESKLHVGFSVTARVDFIEFETDIKRSLSLDFTVGQDLSTSTVFTWMVTHKITNPPNSGNSSITATIYREIRKVPFTAKFKRGVSTWTETGTVEVSHGVINSSIIGL